MPASPSRMVVYRAHTGEYPITNILQRTGPAIAKVYGPINRMNFLAHAYLSFGKPGLLVGNLIADFVRGNRQYGFDPAIQAGIRLHRAIDQFTDNHEATHRAKKLMATATGRYSGVFTDVIYDHFLACDPAYFSGNALFVFAHKTYQTLDQYQGIFPERFQQIFPYMEEYDWLYGYRLMENIAHSFTGIYHRAKFLPESDKAFIAFERCYEELRSCYHSFMPEVTRFAREYLSRSSKERLPDHRI
ncbi:MAG TPA: ACP phosphodiesterase [Chitinophagaceae bacterium]|nr:ACP phosphodiesterase [Chitinophagaceae bacterium]